MSTNAIDKPVSILEEIAIWPAIPEPVPVERIVDGLEGPDQAFVLSAYALAAEFYSEMPPRKNGESAFSHPTNAAYYLRLASAQPAIIAAGLLHDVLEEKVDLVKERSGLTDPKELDRLQSRVRADFASDVIRRSVRTGFPRDVAERVVEIVWTLTRHKSDLYYRSISGIFVHTDVDVRLGGALVKLADRMHNIQTIENYRDNDKLYQVFKNIFILNNAKQLRNEVRTRRLDARMIGSLEKMFKKCGKAAYRSLLRMERDIRPGDPVFELSTYFSLALQKYVLEIDGLWKVTRSVLRPDSPVHDLFDGIVQKYDHRLHYEDDRFREDFERELEYCRTTFAPLHLSDQDLMRGIACKDALALREVIASLIYRDDYVMRGFACSGMCRRGKKCC